MRLGFGEEDGGRRWQTRLVREISGARDMDELDTWANERHGTNAYNAHGGVNDWRFDGNPLTIVQDLTWKGHFFSHSVLKYISRFTKE